MKYKQIGAAQIKRVQLVKRRADDIKDHWRIFDFQAKLYFTKAVDFAYCQERFMAVKITLTRGYEAIIDDEDLERLSKYKWHVSDTQTGTYAVAWMRIEGKGKHVYLHRFLLDFPEGKNIKFINGNTLDCRRENLKATTVAEFHADRGIGLSNRSGFKGVSFNKASGKFKAYISDNGKLLYLGLFETDIEAARAYNEKARELRGETAYLNQIDGETSDV